jgi:hypothetical protein
MTCGSRCLTCCGRIPAGAERDLAFTRAARAAVSTPRGCNSSPTDRSVRWIRGMQVRAPFEKYVENGDGAGGHDVRRR